MKAVDITVTNDIQIVSGDLDISYSDNQHVEHILRANPGQFYQYPDVGYGIYKRLNGNIDGPTEKKLIKQALENDNYSIPSDGINIDTATGKFGVSKYERKA